MGSDEDVFAAGQELNQPAGTRAMAGSAFGGGGRACGGLNTGFDERGHRGLFGADGGLGWAFGRRCLVIVLRGGGHKWLDDNRAWRGEKRTIGGMLLDMRVRKH